MSPAITAAIILLVLLVTYRVATAAFCARREGFASKRAHEVYEKSRELFDKSGGNVTYSTYKNTIEAADPVIYTDVRSLWKSGRLTPDEVQKVV